ncbi:Sec-independent protein translocase protein TatB [Pseudomonas sp. Marseille-P9899]|uniref:Sec-independent protein translocase protein TatB n=1 Tax=Pseudomonas sp. Marseille-P9899 TaxID=2730401 RepID=UPI00158CF742|nr:Sec-independent protein translocase protein TatB [Pseudomonas sp. Marseille-P9899]
MFGISFSELLLVGLVALVVLGPERLPGAARTAGLWVGRLKRSFNAIKQEVEREIGADDIRRQLHNEHILSLEQEARRILNPSSVTPDPATTPGSEPVASATAAVISEAPAAPTAPADAPQPASTEPTQPPRAP